MAAASQRQKAAASVIPARPVFGSLSVLFTMIRVWFFLSYDQSFHVHIMIILPGPGGQKTRLHELELGIR